MCHLMRNAGNFLWLIAISRQLLRPNHRRKPVCIHRIRAQQLLSRREEEVASHPSDRKKRDGALQGRETPWAASSVRWVPLNHLVGTTWWGVGRTRASGPIFISDGPTIMLGGEACSILEEFAETGVPTKSNNPPSLLWKWTGGRAPHAARQLPRPTAHRDLRINMCCDVCALL
jgi:hypothetical protein